MRNFTAFCSLPFSKIKVRSNGDVNMCCYQKGTLGNLLTQDFQEIWSSKLANEIRDMTLASQLHSFCEGWGGCPYLVNPKIPKTISTEHAYPTLLEFDLPNTHCNIGGTSPTPDTACFMCPRSARDFYPDPDFSYEIADRLKFLMPYLTEIRIQGLAEPFWRNQVFEILERLEFQRYNQTCAFSAYTNGSVFNHERRQRFIELCPKAQLFFSLDAATPETYRRIRRLNLFERVLENIRSFVQERKPTQGVEIANNLNLLNLDEAVQMVELAKDLNVDKVQFNPTHDGGTTREDFRELRVGPHNFERFAQAQKQIISRAAELHVKVIFVRPLDLNFSALRRAETQPAQREHVLSRQIIPLSPYTDGKPLVPRPAPPVSSSAILQTRTNR